MPFLRGTPLAPLDDDAADALRRLLDTVTLCVLKITDREARLSSAPVVTSELIANAWRRLMPQGTDPPEIARASGDPSVEAKIVAQRARDVLFALVDNKIAAYRAYNDVDSATVIRRLVDNIQTYYAQFRIPTADGTQLATLMHTYRGRLLQFTREIVLESQRLARRRVQPEREPRGIASEVESHANESIGVLIREWLQQHTVHDTEDGRVRADA